MTFKLNKRTMLAIEAVLDVAFHARPDPVQAREITKRQKIPSRYLEQVMQQLVHTNILKGVRGPRGGYILGQERRKITLGDIIRVVETVDLDMEPEKLMGSELGIQVVAPVWHELNEVIYEHLSKITLEDLCVKAELVGIGRSVQNIGEYTI